MTEKFNVKRACIFCSPCFHSSVDLVGWYVSVWSLKGYVSLWTHAILACWCAFLYMLVWTPVSLACINFNLGLFTSWTKMHCENTLFCGGGWCLQYFDFNKSPVIQLSATLSPFFSIHLSRSLYPPSPSLSLPLCYTSRLPDYTGLSSFRDTWSRSLSLGNRRKHLHSEGFYG